MMDNIEFLILDNLGKHIKFFKRNMGRNWQNSFYQRF